MFQNVTNFLKKKARKTHFLNVFFELKFTFYLKDNGLTKNTNDNPYIKKLISVYK